MGSAMGASNSAALRVCRVCSLRFSNGFVALALAMAIPSFCQAQVTGLGSAANYAILVNNGTGNGTAGDTNAAEIQLHSHAIVNIPGSHGNVGLVNGAGIQLLGTSGSTPYASMTIGGTLSYDSTAWSAPASTNPILLSVSGSPGNTFSAAGGQTGIAKSTSPPDVLTAAWAAAVNASTMNYALTPTQTLAAITGSSATISGSAGTNVISVPSINLSGGSDILTISGNASQFFLINVTASTGTALNVTSILLSGGVTASNVLFNFNPSLTTASVTFASGGTVNGTFLDTASGAAGSGVTLQGTTLNGELIVGGTDNTGGIQFSSSSSSTINMTPIMTESVVATPELPTISMASVALLLVLGGAGFRRVRRFRAA
jgi:hypothetical protein